MTQLLLPIILILVALSAGLVWASLNDRFSKLHKEIDNLRTEVLFLRSELDLLRQDRMGEGS